MYLRPADRRCGRRRGARRGLVLPGRRLGSPGRPAARHAALRRERDGAAARASEARTQAAGGAAAYVASASRCWQPECRRARARRGRRQRRRRRASGRAARRAASTAGTVDGVGAAPAHVPPCAACRAATGLVADGVAGAPTRRTLGWRGGPSLRQPDAAQRALGAGTWRRCSSSSPGDGFPSGTHRRRLRVATWTRRCGASRPTRVSRPDGVAGPRHGACAEQGRSRGHRSCWFEPVRARIGDRFGPRGNRFHPGVDFPAPTGTPGYGRRPRTGRERGLGPRRLREPRGDRAPPGRALDVRAPVARSRCAPGTSVVAGSSRRPRRHDRVSPPARTCTSSCACGAPRSTR